MHMEDLDLREATVTLIEGADGSGPVAPDGTVLMHIIRPGLGRGRGRHLYEASMLEKNAQKFTGWKMFVNHLAPEAKKAMGGLPRDVRDLGGRIVEAWWDPTVPAVSGRFEQGAVVGRAKPTPFIRALIENDPEIVEASISATATGVKPGEHGGQRCWIVEGIEDRGSVDWVTEAGAGGRVVSLMEAAYEQDQDGTLALLAAMDDEEFEVHVREHRPGLIESLRNTPVPRTEEEHMSNITPEVLTEALRDDTTRSALVEALTGDDDSRAALVEALDLDAYVAGLVSSIVGENLPRLVEAAVEAERDVIRATAKADADRRVQIEHFRSTAHGLVEATRLPDVLKDEIKSKYVITEGEASPSLDVIDEVDADGKVTKSATDKLRESVEADIAAKQQVVAALNPARVRGQGPSTSTATDADGKPVVQEAKHGTATTQVLQESGFGEIDPWSVSSPADLNKALQG